MFEFLIDTLEGKPLLGDLENVGACYPDDDVIYMFGVPCRLSSARPTQRVLDSATYERDGLLFCQTCGSGMGAVEDEPPSQ